MNNTSEQTFAHRRDWSLERSSDQRRRIQPEYACVGPVVRRRAPSINRRTDSGPEWLQPLSGRACCGWDEHRTIAVLSPRMRHLTAGVWLLLVIVCLTPRRAEAQSAPSFNAASFYNMQPGTLPVGVVTGVFNNSSGGLLDFAILEQVPNSGSYQVEIFHGLSDGHFCTNCQDLSPNPDLVALGAGVHGNAISAGQFRTAGASDIAVATNNGILFLQNNGAGIFTLDSNQSDTITTATGFVTLAVGAFNGDGIADIAAVTPTVGGSVSFTVFFSNGDGTFTPSSPYPVPSSWNQCPVILPGNFQNQTTGSDLVLLCNNPSEAGALVYLNSGSGGAYSYLYSSTPYTGASFAGSLPGIAAGTLNSQGAIFLAPDGNPFAAYQSNGAGAFTSVSLVPTGLAPRGQIAILNDPPTGAVDFVLGSALSTFTSYTQTNGSTLISGTWNSTGNLAPLGSTSTFASGISNLARGGTYVVINAETDNHFYSDPNVQGPPNFEPYTDQRSLSVALVTLNADGTVATTNSAPLYPPTFSTGYPFPPSFAVGDFNGDGAMDLAVGGANNASGDATVQIYLGGPSGSLPVPPTPTGTALDVAGTFYSGTDAVAAGKFRGPQNGSALYDLAVFSLGEIAIFTSNGDGSFSAGNTYSGLPLFSYSANSPTFAPNLTALDVNGDGFDDLVLTVPEQSCSGSGSPSQGEVYILISNGDGTFQSPVAVTPPVVNPVSMTSAKFFGSTLPDLVFADGGEICAGNTAPTTGTAVGILQNNILPGTPTLSSASFTAGVILPQAPILPEGSDPGAPDITAVASADLNGDGRPDLIVSSAAGIQVLLNQGNGSFLPTAQGVVPLFAGDIVPGSLCNSANNYVGCVSYDSQVITGKFFAAGETDVAAAVDGLVFIFQNQNNSGTLVAPTQGFVAGPDSGMISAALTGSSGLNNLLVATSQGTAYLVNNATAGGPPFANYTGNPQLGTGVTVSLTASANGGVAIQQLVLSNTGTGPLSVSGMSLSGVPGYPGSGAAWSIASALCGNTAESSGSFTPVSLAPGQSCTVTLQFAPTATDFLSNTSNLTIIDTATSSNAGSATGGQTIPLNGTGTAPFAHYTLSGLFDFGTIYANTSATQTVTLTNTGNGALTFSGLSFSSIPGVNGGGFSYTQILCNGTGAQLPVILSSGQSCTITVQFDPPTAGSYQANLNFIDDATAAETDLYGQNLLAFGTGLADADLSVSGVATGTGFTGVAYAFWTRILNSGPEAVTNLTVTYTLSSPVQFLSLTGAGGYALACPLPAPGSTVSSFSCNFGAFGVGSPIVSFLNFVPLTSGTLILTTAVSSDQFDPNTANNSFQVTATVTLPPPPPPPSPILTNLSFQLAAGSPIGVGPRPSMLASGDFNQDGIPDLAIVNAGDNTVSILLGNGDGSFKAPVKYVVNRNPFPTPCLTGCGSLPMSITAASFRGNGVVDLAITNIPINDGCNISALAGGPCASVAILLGNGDGTFQPSNQVSLHGQLPISIAAGDFNGDGVPDLAIADLNSSEVEILVSDRQGGFSEPNPPVAVGNQPASITSGQFTASLHQDLAVANAGDGTVSVLLGNGNGTFGLPTNYSVGGRPVCVVAADLTGTVNGNLDLAVASLSSSTVTVLFGNGQGSFSGAQSYGVGGEPASIAVGFFGGNTSVMDLAVADRLSNTISVLFNTGNGTFASPKNIPVGLNPQSLVAADFNLDNWPDIASVNAGSGTVSVLLNVHGFTSPTAAAPAPLVAVGSKLMSLNLDPGSSSQQFAATLSLSNTGNVASSIHLTGATLNGVNSSSVPISIGLAPNSASNVTVNFPSTAGAPGTRAVLSVKGTYSAPQQGGGTSNGNWAGGFRVTLPASTP